MPRAEIEIALHGEGKGYYAVELRFQQPDNDVEMAAVRGRARFDFERLRARATDPVAYGKLLAAALFKDEKVKTSFAEARANAESHGHSLRIRLLIGSSAPDLHALRWETLLDPRNGQWLLQSETLIFSRLVGGLDWRPVRLRRLDSLGALVVVASPVGLEENWDLAPINSEDELKRAHAGLGDIPIDPLEPGVRATLPKIVAALRRKDYDILYLACHGAFRDGEPLLFLEDDERNVAQVRGSDLVAQIGNLERRPRLIVLASCESAGKGAGGPDPEALAALGPRFAEAGIPAVLAMQGSVSMSTIAKLMPAFFRELRVDGRIDRALAVARKEVWDQPDRWMPALFLRLKGGKLWYNPGFTGEHTLQRWDSLVNNIDRNRCTPILGSALLDAFVGSSSELAQRLAEIFHFPLNPHERQNLPQVAQYLATIQQDVFVRDQLVDRFQDAVSRRFPNQLQETPPSDRVRRLIDAFSLAGQRLRKGQPAEPHRVLASLPFSLYITTNPDSLLVDALKEQGKQPQVELCRWREDIPWPPSIYADKACDYQPTVKNPLVYYLFGRLQEPESIVVTEDDYFDYLIGVTRPAQDSPHPQPVLRAQGRTSLLFLGFKMEDWDFRVFFRSLRGREGGGWNKNITHVAVQIAPEEGTVLDTARAREYLKQYFQGAKIDIYWGHVVDFMRELQVKWNERRETVTLHE